MNPDLGLLQPYPFEKLSALKHGIEGPQHLDHIALYIGEPKHPTPQLVSEALLAHLHQLSVYPSTRGSSALREAIAEWLTRRFKLTTGEDSPVAPASLGIDPESQILPVNGTREALFSFAQAVIDRAGRPLVLMPNPCYQIYEGAALLAGAQPHYLACRKERDFIPDFDSVDEATWKRCQLIYICSPGNPTAAVIGESTLCRLIELAHRHDFVIASDECYSELYLDESDPPPGLLQAAAAMGDPAFKRCMVFHSLSKRSNAPGLRSGFVAGDAALIEAFLSYRTYHGCAMSPAVQSASTAAWGDEGHVRENRQLYRVKLAATQEILREVMELETQSTGFYLWPETPISDTLFARRLFAEEHVTVLPGSFLSRDVEGGNPGANRVRIALTPSLEACVDAAWRMRRLIERL